MGSEMCIRDRTRSCLARLGVPYSGCSPGRAVLEALKHLMKPSRRPVTEAHKRHLLSLQNNQCAVCPNSLSETAWECDHVPRRIESAETSVRILCLECHTQVTSEQQSVGNVWDFQSRFSPHAVEKFHNLPATPPLIFSTATPLGRMARFRGKLTSFGVGLTHGSTPPRTGRSSASWIPSSLPCPGSLPIGPGWTAGL